MVNLSAAAPKLFTVADFEAFLSQPENGERRFELIQGEVVEKVPTEEHGAIAALIAYLLNSHVIPNKLGRVAVEPRHRIPEDEHNARMPDIAFTSAARALPLVTRGSVPQMPDLAIEIQSPDDSPRLMREKAAYYLNNGARLVWLVYPASRSVEVCSLSAADTVMMQTFEAEAWLEGGAVLPDWRVQVGALFDVV